MVAQGLGADSDMQVRLVVVVAVGEAGSFAGVDLRLDCSLVVARAGRIRLEGRPCDNSWPAAEQERVRAPRQGPCQADYIAPAAEELAGLAGCIADMVAEDLASKIHQEGRPAGMGYPLVAAAALVAEELAGLVGYIVGMVVVDLASKIHQVVHLAGTGYFPAADLAVVELGVASIAEVVVELVGKREVVQLGYY